MKLRPSFRFRPWLPCSVKPNFIKKTLLDRGSVTVEIALGFCALTVLCGFIFTGFAAVTYQLRCEDAAHEVARLVARGQTQLAQQVGLEIAPSGAVIHLQPVPQGVQVEVKVDLAGFSLRGKAFTLLEPGVRKP